MPAAENSNGDSNFGQGWEVVHVAHEGRHVEHRVGMFDCKPTDVEAVEDHAEQNDDCTDQQAIGALCDSF